MWVAWHKPMGKICSKTCRAPEGEVPWNQVDKDLGIDQFCIHIMMLRAYPESERASEHMQADIRKVHWWDSVHCQQAKASLQQATEKGRVDFLHLPVMNKKSSVSFLHKDVNRRKQKDGKDEPEGWESTAGTFCHSNKWKHPVPTISVQLNIISMK